MSGKALLRFLTCGSVDDGKSTLIGRLLYDTASIPTDQLATLERDSRKHGTTGTDLDLALLVDGLEAEREQGITIDVAYRYFSSPRRAFIVADTPGHEQYTRNMATGASNADAAVLLVDARKGVLTQTRRHAYICSLLGLRHVVAAVNKIDLVDDAPAVFARIEAELRAFAAPLGFQTLTVVPVSARFGDNVSAPSERLSWFQGPTLLGWLEELDVSRDRAAAPLRFPVQYVNRPNVDFRGYVGTVASGVVRAGQSIVVAGSGKQTTVARIVTADGDLAEAQAGEAVTLTLTDEIDIARGDVLSTPETRPEVADQFAAHVLWMAEEELLAGRPYLMRLGTATVPVRITGIKYKVDVNSLEHLAARTLHLNEVGFCNLDTTAPVAVDAFADFPATGSFIFIDRQTNATVGAGMVSFALRRATNVHRQAVTVDRAARERLNAHPAKAVWFTGLSGSGKSTIANVLEQKLHAQGIRTYLLDGDNVRHGLNRDLGFTDADRVENIRRVGEVARLMTDAGLVVLCSFISPFRAERQMVRELFAPGAFVEVFVDTAIEDCIQRDPKGLYARAQAGKLKNFTGIDSPYEAPLTPEVHLQTQGHTPEEAVEQLLALLGL